jgi:hypothetical protein
MDLLPSLQQKRQLFGYNPYGATNLTARHVVGPDQVGCALGPNQVDLGLSVPEHVNMGRRMVIDINDDTEAVGPQHGNHIME